MSMDFPADSSTDLMIAPKNKKWRKTFQANKYLLLLFLPCLLYYLLFKYLPIVGIAVSFKNYNIFKGVWASEWVGFKYYRLFFNNPDCYKLIRNTFLLGVYRLLFEFPAPIVLALLLNELKNQAFKRFVQTVSYLPHFISNVVVAGMVTLFLSPTFGIVNKGIRAFGIESVNFMVVPGFFRTIYISSEVWQHIGWSSIIYLAAVTAIDPQLYEAAEIDGANRWRKVVHVTFPGIFPVIVIMFILNVGQVLEIGFEKVFLLYNAATYETADIISTYVYRVGIIQGNFSYATAIDLFTGVISLVFLLSANTISRKLGDESLW